MNSLFSDLSVFFLSFTLYLRPQLFPKFLHFLRRAICHPLTCPYLFPLFYDLLLLEMKVCYDWSKGAENHNPSTAKTHIYLHLPQVQFIVLNYVLVSVASHLVSSVLVKWMLYLLSQEAEVKGKPRAGTSSRKWGVLPILEKRNY